MGRFSDNGLRKDASTVTENGSSDSGEKPKNQKTNNLVVEGIEKVESLYTEAQMKPVNVGGFRVPLVVRAHWQSSAKLQGDKVATLLREFLTERYGLPDGISDDDLFC